MLLLFALSFFFFNDPPTPEIYPLPLHDALRIFVYAAPRPVGRGHGRPGMDGGRGLAGGGGGCGLRARAARGAAFGARAHGARRLHIRPLPDPKSTRLNSSHSPISYAVLCLEKKT